MVSRTSSTRFSALRRSALLAATAASLATMLSLPSLVLSSPLDRPPSHGRGRDPFEFADLSRPIAPDPEYAAANHGHEHGHAVAEAASQAGTDDDDVDSRPWDNDDDDWWGAISAGPGGVHVGDIFAGPGGAGIVGEVYAGHGVAWVAGRDEGGRERKRAEGHATPSKQESKADPRSEDDRGKGTNANSKGDVWTDEAGALGCPGGGDRHAILCSATAASSPSLTARYVQATQRSTNQGASLSRHSLSPSTPTPAPQRTHPERVGERRHFSQLASASLAEADLFPQFSTYVTMTHATTSWVNFGPKSNLNATIPAARSRANNDSGNGQAPTNINNPDSPDLGWLDTFVGAVPYKNGDLAASVVWILATLCLIPLLLIRMIRTSSLISSVLFTIVIYMVLMLVGFGMRAKLADQTPTTPMMEAMTIILAILLPLLLEPLIALLSLYSTQAGRQTGVPTAAMALRVFNFIVFLLFLVAAAYDAAWLNSWDKALRNRHTAQELPPIQPPGVVRIAPVAAAVIELILILGTALLIPVARGDNGNMRPGGFIFFLLSLLLLPCVYRILQSLHATARLSEENGDGLHSTDLLPFFSGGSSKSTTDDERVANGLSLAPQGMYGPYSDGIAWQQLQLTMASRGSPQTPVIFNLVYVFPMWLMVFLLFFAHAPGGKKKDNADGDGGDA
ncbi:hypothetical protein ACQY0O_001798 [Thecaphora frezii]